MLSADIRQAYRDILFEELRPAMGCTEPIAISYAAAIAKSLLPKEVKKLEVGLSGNIIKNVKSVIVPATGGKHGIEAAIALNDNASATPIPVFFFIFPPYFVSH